MNGNEGIPGDRPFPTTDATNPAPIPLSVSPDALAFWDRERAWALRRADTAAEKLGHPVGHRKTDPQLILAANLGHVGRTCRPLQRPAEGGSLTQGLQYAQRQKARAQGLLALARHVLGAGPKPPVTRTWRLPRSWQLDQGDTPQCVAYTKAHWHRSLPVALRYRPPAEDYAQAKLLDGYPTEEGTDAGAMLKVALAEGVVDSTWWWQGPHDTASLDQWLLTVGPIWLGANWAESMFRTSQEPREAGRIVVTGPCLYGHETLLIGSDRQRRRRMICNSWGVENWGVQGRGWIADRDFDRLMDEGWGDAVGIVERRTP